MEKFIFKDVWWWILYVNYIVINEVNNCFFVIMDQEEIFLKFGIDCGWGFFVNLCILFFFLECIEDNYVIVDFFNFYIEFKKFGYVLCKIIILGNIQFLICGYLNFLGFDVNMNISVVKWSGKLFVGERL